MAPIEEPLVAAATAGDEAAFAQLVERHRGELQVHAYRMLGSLEDAQDAVQDALFRAWRGRATYQARSSFRAWLYRITTNACLRALERRPRRVVPYEASAAAEPGTHPLDAYDLPWLQPYPDRLLDDVPEPADLVVARETVELAFLAAIQHLPPRQRAALILRDALDWSAAETAAVLEMSVPAVNSALQRARATMSEHLPSDRLESAGADAAEAERSLLDSYMEAWERADASGLAALLREDVRMAMPPSPTWFDGRDAIFAFFSRHAFAPGKAPYRLVPTAANRQPAFGVYRVDEAGVPKPFAIQVVRLAHGLVADIHFFVYRELFPAFGLPDSLR